MPWSAWHGRPNLAVCIHAMLLLTMHIGPTIVKPDVANSLNEIQG